MFQKLKNRWGVNSVNLILIITTFALGGSLCGYVGRKILLLTTLDRGIVWIVLYILLITLLWPLCVLLISIPLGQFLFFKKYIHKIGRKLVGNKQNKVLALPKIAIFASGAGSNAEKIIAASKKDRSYSINLIVCNNPNAGVLTIAKKAGIPVLLIARDKFFNDDNNYLPELQKLKINFIVLAGFLWKVPQGLIKAFPKKIINIHPALLPKYGGKGMYGQKVHEAVIASGEKESGITIHYVDEFYDNGEIIFQATCPVTTTDNGETLASKIHELEHLYYPSVIHNLLIELKG